MVEVVTTSGDVMLDTPLTASGSEGFFTNEIEKALQAGQIDLAVHSLKDMPIQNPAGLTIGAIPERANPADVLVSRAGGRLAELPPGAQVGTSSLRRAGQLRHTRPDLQVVNIRGNVDTRLNKVFSPEGIYDATILAFAGLERIGRLEVLTEILPLELMLPAPGQAALAVQCRAEAEWLELLSPLNHPGTLLSVTAERAFLQGLGGGCALTVAAHAEDTDQQLALCGRVCSVDGSQQLDLQRAVLLTGTDDLKAADQLGVDLAKEALARGAIHLLSRGSNVC